MDHLVLILGLALVSVAMLQFGLWTGRGLRLRQLEGKRFDLELEKLRAEIFQITQQRQSGPPVDTLPNSTLVDESGNWTGFRTFTVQKLVRETKNCTSVYFCPADGMSIANFEPGQHLTLRLNIPGRDKRVVRCYTLSDCPNGKSYRISVKVSLPPTGTDLPDGLASSWINRQMIEGQQVELKAPSGAFYLQAGTSPVVLLAGGIGITPMVSMLNFIAETKSKRESLLFYGVRDGEDHTFNRHLNQLAADNENIHVANFYSKPSTTDRPNEDYHVRGFVSIDLLKQILPNPNYDFYLCGPPPFMNSIHAGLLQWGVDESRIRYEAFGPASIGKQAKQAAVPSDIPVVFSQSQKTVAWDGSHENLLELIEDQDIAIDSGCRAGSCGTCQTRILGGQVIYDEPDMIDCEEGHCLPCVAKPTEAIELDV